MKTRRRELGGTHVACVCLIIVRHCTWRYALCAVCWPPANNRPEARPLSAPRRPADPRRASLLTCAAAGSAPRPVPRRAPGRGGPASGRVPWCSRMADGTITTRAPPCMRWRGLARPCSPACRSLGWPVTRLLSAADQATPARGPPGNPVSRLSVRSGVAPGAPGSPPDQPPRAVVSAFLLPLQGLHKGLRTPISRFFGHPQDTCRYPLRSTAYPPVHPHGGPQPPLGAPCVSAGPACPRRRRPGTDGPCDWGGAHPARRGPRR